MTKQINITKQMTLAELSEGTEVNMTVVIQHELFFNSDNGWGAYQTKDSFGEKIQMTGYFMDSLEIQHEYDIKGVIRVHKGKNQIEVSRCQRSYPTNSKGMIKALQNIPGILTLANTIYATFEMQSLEILKTNPTLVAQKIKHLSLKKAQEIQNYLLTEAQGMEILAILLGYHLSVKEAQSLYRRHTHTVLDKIKANPYWLIDELESYSFKQADTLAQQFQISLNHPHRLEAGLRFTLKESAKMGHCFLPTHLFWSQAIQLLSHPTCPLTVEDFEEPTQRLLESKRLILKENCFYLPHHYEAEQFVAQKLIQLSDTTPIWTREEVEECLDNLLNERQIQLETEQREACIQFNLTEGGVYVLDGSAGTGKTFTLKLMVEVGRRLYHQHHQIEMTNVPQSHSTHLTSPSIVGSCVGYEVLQVLNSDTVEVFLDTPFDDEDLLANVIHHYVSLDELETQEHLLDSETPQDGDLTPKEDEVISIHFPFQVVYMAPTGKAAKQMKKSTGEEATTIHRGLKYDPTNGFAMNESQPLDANWVVIDETSMLDLALAKHLLRAISLGTKLIFMGDTKQLPSVGAGNVLQDIIESQCFPRVTLKVSKRQSELSGIHRNAQAIIQGQALADCRDTTQDTFILTSEFRPRSQAFILKSMERLLTQGRYSFDQIQVLSCQRKGLLGTDSLNLLIQSQFNSQPDEHQILAKTFSCLNWETQQEEYHELYFKTGDRVINLENNYTKIYYEKRKSGRYEPKPDVSGITNGECGIIVEILTQPSKKGKSKFKKTIVVAFDAGYLMYESDEWRHLEHAYCLTIHKSQGSGWPAVILPIDGEHWNMLDNNLIYTAITRAESFLTLVGDPKAMNHAIRTHRARHRYTHLTTQLQQFQSKKGLTQ